MGLLRNIITSSVSSSTPAVTAAGTRLSDYPATASTTANTTTTTMMMTTTTVMTTVTPLCPNGSVPLCHCVSSSPGNFTRGTLSEEGSLDALMYIVVVLLFYAFSIVVMMVKYIRRENKEAYLRQYFDDFVAREHFHSAQARNQIFLKTIMDKRTDPYLHGVANPDLSREPAGAQDHQMKFQQDVPFCIPETISELVEDDEDMEFESAEDELLDDQFQVSGVRTETCQANSLEELLPRRTTPV